MLFVITIEKVDKHIPSYINTLTPIKNVFEVLNWIYYIIRECLSNHKLVNNFMGLKQIN